MISGFILAFATRCSSQNSTTLIITAMLKQRITNYFVIYEFSHFGPVDTISPLVLFVSLPSSETKEREELNSIPHATSFEFSFG